MFKLYMRCIATPHHNLDYLRRICQLKSTPRRAAAARSEKSRSKNDVVYGKCELDSHADTIVAGSNCKLLNYTGKVCDVTPYRDDYEPVTNIPIVKAATAWQSPHTGQVYILIFNEALWMGDTMETTLLNPNQLRHFGTKVQDDPTSDKPLSIITEDEEFCMDLHMQGTIIFMDTHTPSSQELDNCPHIVLSSPHAWDPHTVRFPQSKYSLHDVMTDSRFVSAASSKNAFQEDEGGNDDAEVMFSLTAMHRKIGSMKTIPEEPLTKGDIDSGTTDTTPPHTFTSKS